MIVQQDNLIPGLEKITGETVDITEYCDSVLWNLDWYSSDLKDELSSERWLDVSHPVGSAPYNQLIAKNINVSISNH